MLLPMVSHGPIGICSCCCRWLCMGPLVSQQVLPIASFGPIGIFNCCCRWFHVGPWAYAAAAANYIAWAHRHMQLLLSMALHGPIKISSSCCPMVPCGPIGICGYCCRWLHMGPSTYAATVVDSFGWAHQHMWLLLSMASHGPIEISSC